MLQKIILGDFEIYTNQIIHNKVFSELYNKENSITKFETIITTSSHHPSATFLARERYLAGVKEKDWIIIRAVKGNKKFEFITKILRWGKFAIPKIMIETLSIKNHEKILFEVVKQNNYNRKVDKNFIDLTKIKENIKVIYRENNFITLFKEYKTPITLPRFIKITSELIEAVFLIHGDGHYQYKLYFVNKNSELHKFVMEKFEDIFNIPKELWRARLLFNNESDREVAKNKWKKDLALKEEQFYPSISQCILKTSNLGNLRIVIDKTVVSVVFRYILSQLVNLNKKQALYALNGLLYAEGGARKNKEGLHKITLSFNQEEKKMFQNILNSTGIGKLSIIHENRMFVISGWENLYKFFTLFFLNSLIPFEKHTERCTNALGGFLNHSFTRTMEKYLNILTNKSKTVNELVKITGNQPTSILNTLRKPQYARFITIEGRGVNKNPFIVSITQEGISFLKLIQDIKEVYNEKCRLRQDKERKEYKRIIGVWSLQHRQATRTNIFPSFRPC